MLVSKQIQNMMKLEVCIMFISYPYLCIKQILKSGYLGNLASLSVDFITLVQASLLLYFVEYNERAKI